MILRNHGIKGPATLWSGTPESRSHPCKVSVEIWRLYDYVIKGSHGFVGGFSPELTTLPSLVAITVVKMKMYFFSIYNLSHELM